MPKKVLNLTDVQIRSAKPGETKNDGKGLELVVDVNGNRRWVLRYKRTDGRRNMVALDHILRCPQVQHV